MLFGGKFTRFMQGFKHKGFITTGQANKGDLDPSLTSINFAVPSDRVLSTYCPITSLKDCNETIQPGPIKPLLDICGQSHSNKSHVLSFDGKKIVPNSADIDLMGCEDDDVLNQQKCVREDLKCIQDLEEVTEKLQKEESMEHIGDIEQKNWVIDKLMGCFRCIGIRMQNVRQLKERKSYALKKLQDKDTGSSPKDHYHMNYLKTYIYQSTNALKDGVDSINRLCKIIAHLQESSYDFQTNTSIDLDSQRNYASLLQPSEVRNTLNIPPEEQIPSHYIKQRTEEWHELRGQFLVTGSTVSRAIGLESLKEQKLFRETMISGQIPQHSEYVLKAMEYGSRNEINAIATLVGKIIPVLFPSLVYCEEGTYIIKDDVIGTNLLAVSPDGSLRRRQDDGAIDLSSNPAVSVEIKCPFSCAMNVAPIYSSVPKRHICQSLLEQRALQSDRHILLCWSEESTTVFEIPTSDEIVTDVLKEAQALVTSPMRRKPTKRSQKVLEISDKIGKHGQNCIFLGEFPSINNTKSSEQRGVLENCPYKVNTANATPPDILISKDETYETLVKCITLIKNFMDLYNKKASEVVVFTLADSDRCWNKEIGHGIPVGYFFKGYSLTSHVMRNIAKKMYISCLSSNLDVACITFDGQWFKLLEEAEVGSPLTLFQVHRNHWRNVGKYSVNELLDLLCNVRSTAKVEILLQPRKHLSLSSDQPCLRTPGNCASHKDNNQLNQSESDKLVNNGTSEDGKSHAGYTLSSDDTNAIGEILRNSSRKRNPFSVESTTHERIHELFASSRNIESLTDSEIKEVMRYISNKKDITTKISMKGNKSDRLKSLCRFLNLPISLECTSFNKKPKHVIALKEMCRSHLKAKGKKYLEAVYAQYSWEQEERKWRDTLPVSSEVYVDGLDKSFIPMYSPGRDACAGEERLLLSCIDGHHLRSNIRAKLCRTGTDTLNKNAWIAVAASRRTPLTLAMINQDMDGKILDQQDDRFIRTMFCESVEEELRDQGYEEEAMFTKLLRRWHDAEDKPGIASIQRCDDALKFRQWLLQHVDLCNFPPSSQSFKGIPRITFEGLVCNIEAHLFMYPISKSGTYNWRSMSTLVAENFFGEIAEMESHRNGVPSGNSFKRDISVMTGLTAVRLKPNKYVFVQFYCV